MQLPYIINDCGVCTNPTILYFYQKKNALAWNYVQLSYAQFPNGKWAFGFSVAGGGSSPSIHQAIFTTKEEAIQQAKTFLLEKLKERVEYYSSGYCVSKTDCIEQLNNFIYHEAQQQQLVLF